MGFSDGSSVPLVASWGARTSAVEWGTLVKQSFDTFLPDLAKKLNFPPLVTRGKQKELWLLFSRVVTYRSVKSLEKLDDKVEQLYKDTPLQP